MANLTARQLQVLEFLASFWRENGFPASHREICERFSWASTKAANDHLVALQKKGAIACTRGDSRSVRITPTGWAFLGVNGCPLCGNRKENAA